MGSSTGDVFASAMGEFWRRSVGGVPRGLSWTHPERGGTYDLRDTSTLAERVENESTHSGRVL